MVVQGARLTTNITQERRVIDMAKDIALLDPNIAPFLSVLKLLKKDTRVAYSPKIEWLEDDYLATVTTVPSAVGAAATSVTVADGSIIRPNDILNIPSTQENMLVTAVAGNVLTVVRGFGSVAGAAVAANATVLVIGNAQAENALARERRSTLEVPKYNLTQIFRTPVEISNTEKASKLYGGKDRPYQQRKASAEHKRDIARSIYFGQRNAVGAQRTMGGLVEFISGGSNVAEFDSAGLPFTWKEFNNTVAQGAFKHNPDGDKLMIVGSLTAAAIDGWAIDKLYTKVEKNATYGIHVKELVTTYGNLKVIYDPLLDGEYAGFGLVCDMDNVRYAHLEGRDTKLHTNIQPNDQDGVMDEYLTECSIEVKNPDTHFLFSGAYIA